jgi:inhibitor of KinA
MPRLLDAGDAAFTVEFGDRVDARLLASVNALDRVIAAERDAGRLRGLVETMPTFRSLTVFFDPLLTGRGELIEALRPLLEGAAQAAPLDGRRWRLPVCYEGEAAPDLDEVARATGLGRDDVVALHSGTEVRVYMLGFLPGFPFMGDVPQPLRLPRRTEPRVRVPAGSVSIAGELTAIYPWQSPGGWHLLGRCPVPLFDARRDPPSLLAPGDRVRFEAIAMGEFDRLQTAMRAGDIDPRSWLDVAEGEERGR